MNTDIPTPEQNAAMLTIAAWKKSHPALSRWFHGPVNFFEFLQHYDSQLASAACRSHLEAMGDHEPLKDMNIGAVASLDEAPPGSVWYNGTICNLCKYLNASYLWAVCYTPALIH